MEDSVVLDKNSKSKECRGFLCKKHTSAAAYMIELTFVNVLYSLHIGCMHKKYTNATSVS